MKQHFAMMADYNRWANARLYEAAASLSDELFRRPVGVYFKSLRGTLNHLLVADRIWMHRLDRTGTHPDKLAAIVFEDLPALRSAREVEDQRIVRYIEDRSDADFGALCEYATLSGAPQQQRIRDILAHLFNHQTHHRGQAHAVLTLLGMREPVALDLLIMQREKSSAYGD
jgi:uncharacterized damage-inducible protein DinB